MADNVNLTAGDGTIVAGADVIGGVAYPRAKVVWGPDNTVNDTDVASGKPLPVQLRTSTGTATPLPALGTAGSASTDVITIQGIASGTVVPISVATIPSHAVTNAGTFAVQSAQSGTWTVQPGNTANTTAWKVDGSAVTQPISNLTLTNFGAGEYETVAASQTAQALGATGATGDYISGLLVVPATTSPGNILLLDNATSITVFTGGASSVSNLVPFFIPLGMVSVSGAWKVTTGANVSVIGIGNFT